jgi:hypothetical protein
MHAIVKTRVAHFKPIKIIDPARLTPALFVDYVKDHLVAFLVTLSVVMGGLYPTLVTHASTTIEIDTDVLFSAVNGWITTFLPIAAIGLGIAIALAVIAFVGDAILQGFKGRH